MKKIELEQWEPFPGDPQRMQYAGQRVAQEVFEELKHRLEGMGYLPDEYFLMDREWENGREIPKDADIFCTTDYGGNEGVYLDVYLKWYEDSRPVTKSFITGKTLGETGADLDRMFLISSAITKAFHGDGETYARHLRQGERAEPEGMIVHLNPTEQRTIIEALVEQQERQEQAMSQTEQLLRRMTGSITAYMDEVGRYPLHISDYDKTVLAIRDGEFDAFKNLYPRVSDQTDDLLIEVAGRPGVVGGNMTLILLAAVERFSPEAYLTACKRAVETGDSWRVQTLVKESEGRLSEPLPSLHGEVILYAYTNNCRNIAKDLIAQCTPEQIASVPPKLLRWVAEKLDFQTAVDLVDKGVRPGDEVRTLTGQHQEWMAERLLEHGMPVEPDNYDALYACVSNQAVGAAKLLLDRGIDLEQYQLWAEHRPKGDGYTETMEELAIPPSEIQILGRGDFICNQRGFLLRPLPGLVSPAGLATLRPAPAEVAEVFTVPVEFFRATLPQPCAYDLIPRVPESFPYEAVGIPRDYPWNCGKVEVPVWLYGGHAIWGMTARIVRDLVSHL